MPTPAATAASTTRPVAIAPPANHASAISATGAAKPVVLTHKNITAVLASVAPLFKITRRDSGLSVLPLHQTFELTCGLLLPLLRGAHVTYVDELSACLERCQRHWEAALEAVRRGSEERMAPILMTAITAGLALIPLVIASGAPGNEIQSPMAQVILGGLITSTFLNLVVVPALYLRK